VALQRIAASQVSALLAFTLLAGCLPGGELDALNPTAGNQPPAVDGSANGVDGLLVGHRLMEAGEYELALKAYYRAGAEQGVNVDVLSAIGSADLKLGRLGQAEQILRQALQLDPTFVPALNNLGVVLMEAGKPGEAQSYFQQAYALDSGNSDEIRENLKLAIAQAENSVYAGADQSEEPQFSLVRRGPSEYELLSNL
jgi:Flp pilus assembly protein TadD